MLTKIAQGPDHWIYGDFLLSVLENGLFCCRSVQLPSLSLMPSVCHEV